jgi:hypothetical protein
MAPNKEDELEDSEALLQSPADIQFPPKQLHSPGSAWKTNYARLILEIIMGILIIFLALRPLSTPLYIPQKSSPVPDCTPLIPLNTQENHAANNKQSPAYNENIPPRA